MKCRWSKRSTWHRRSRKRNEIPTPIPSLSSSSFDTAGAAYDSSQVSAGKTSPTARILKIKGLLHRKSSRFSFLSQKNVRTVDILTMREKHAQLGIFIASAVARKVTSEQSVVRRTNHHIQVRAHLQVRSCAAYLLASRNASRRPLQASPQRNITCMPCCIPTAKQLL